MKRLAAIAVLACIGGCSYGPATPAPTACDVAHAKRQNVPNLVASGSIAAALIALDQANAACPETRKETRGDEVKLLADLGRCEGARELANAIDADRDTSDGAWLAASVARARCAGTTAQPSVPTLAAEGRVELEAGRLSAARRLFDRALASAAREGLAVHAECTHWSHKGRVVSAYQSGTRALVVTDGDHALVLSADDGRERLYLAGHSGPITHVAASDDGRWILTASKDDVILWSTEDGTKVFGHPGTGPLAFSADGRRFAFVVDDKVLNLGRIGGPMAMPLALAAKVKGLAVLADRVAVSLEDDTFRVFGDDGKEKSRASHDAVRFVVPLAGGLYLLAGKPLLGDGSPSAFGADVLGGGPSRAVVEGLDEVRGSDATGHALLVEKDSEMVVRDALTGKDSHAQWADGGLVAGQKVFFFDERDDLRVWDTATQKERLIVGSTSAELRGIAISPDAASMLVTFEGPARLSGRSHWEHLWSGSGGLPFPKTDVYAQYFQGDDRFLLGQAGEKLEMFSAHTGALWGQFHYVRGTDRSRVQLSRSGRFVVLRWGLAYVRADLANEVPETDLPYPFLRFEGDELVVVRDHDEAWLDPVSLRELRHGTAEAEDDTTSATRDCRYRTTRTDCFSMESNDTGPWTFSWIMGDGTKLPFEPYPHTTADYGEGADRYIAVAYKEGTIVFYGPKGGPILLHLHPFADGTGGYAVSRDGELELFGDAEKRAVCRVGALSLPFVACEERFRRTGLLESVMRTGGLPRSE